MGYTSIEKILMTASGQENVVPGDIVKATPSFYLSHDNTGEVINKLEEVEKKSKEIILNNRRHQLGIMTESYIEGIRRRENFEKELSENFLSSIERIDLGINYKINPKDPSKIVIIFDHTVGSDNPKHHEYHNAVREFVKGYPEIQFYDDKAGVCHQVFMEEGYAQPGSLIIGADSHTTLHGAANAAGIPINRTEMAGLWIRDWIELVVPETIQIELEGSLRKGVYSKDIALYLLSQMGSNGANYRALEFTGNGIGRLSMSERMTITNMGIELGAKTAVMPYDSVLVEYLAERKQRTNPNPVFSDLNAKFLKKIKINLDSLEAMISKPHDVENVVTLSEVEGTKITHAYLGSCTNGRYEDLEIAAKLLEGKRINPNVHLSVYPASKRVEDEAKATGIYDTIVSAGAIWMIPACGPCFGSVGAILQDGEVCISSSNRNFRGRMGSPNSSVYLGSPATVIASAITGEITSEGKL